MRISVVMLIALLTLAFADKSNHWAVLVAGSKGYWNYRHQADVCHAYQVVKASGIPEEQIIVLAYDDVASHKENPFPGQLFNQKDGQDVYKDCKIDYKGDSVTPQTFFEVLRGTAKGKSLKGDSESKVFIYFSDHGAPGLIAFPKDELHANDLYEHIKQMHDNHEYKEMVLYIEACESGSMFQDILGDDLNVYATTAANPSQPSYGYYCHPDDTINGTSIGT